MAKRKAAKRELIDTGADKRYVRRGTGGRFKESDDVGRATAADRHSAALIPAENVGKSRDDAVYASSSIRTWFVGTRSLRTRRRGANVEFTDVSTPYAV